MKVKTAKKLIGKENLNHEEVAFALILKRLNFIQRKILKKEISAILRKIGS